MTYTSGLPTTLGAILIAFGDVDSQDADGSRRRIPADALFANLIEQEMWLSPRSIDAHTGDMILFYMKGKGICGYARVAGAAAASDRNFTLPSKFGVRHFQTKLKLSDVVRIDPPVDLKPISEQLVFIKNKKQWGTGLRSTPRHIPIEDAKKILAAAQISTTLA